MIRTTVLLTLRKDLRRTWPLLAVLYAALAGWTVLAIETWPGPSEFWAAALIQLNLTVRLTAMLAAGWALLDDPPAGRDPFWATRPLSRDGLLIAKLVFLAVGVASPVLAARAIVMSAGDAALALWVGLGLAVDLLMVGTAALLAGFTASLPVWTRSALVLLVVFWIGGFVLLYRSAPLTRLAVALFVVALGVGILWWRYRGRGSIDWLVPPAVLSPPRRTRRFPAPRARAAGQRRGFAGEVGHHLAKDLRRLWPVVAALVLLLVYRLLVVIPAEPLSEKPPSTGDWWWEAWFPLAVMFPVGLAVVEDSPAGGEPYWATRPVHPGRLAVAKGAWVLGCVMAPILGIEAIALLAYGLAPHRLPAALAEAALSLVPAMAAALAVSVLVRPLVAWAAVLIALPIAHISGAALLALVLRPFAESREGLDGWILGSLVALLGGIVLLAVAYRRRRGRITLSLALSGWLVYALVRFFWPWDLLQPWLQYRAAPQMVRAGELAVEPLERETQLRSWGSDDPGVAVQVRLAVHGLPPEVAVLGDLVDGRLAGASGEIDPGSISFGFGDEQALAAALGDLDLLDRWPGDRQDEAWGLATLTFLPTEEFERLAERPLAYRGRLRLIPYRYVEHAEVPVAAAAGARLRRGSYEALVLEVERAPHVPGLEAVERDFVLRFDGGGNGVRSWLAGAKFLRNARRGAALRIDGNRGGSEMMIALEGSTIVALAGGGRSRLVTLDPSLEAATFTHWLSHANRWPPERPAAWLDDADLLWFKRIEGRPIEVELTIEDLVLRREDLESFRSRRREWLEDERDRAH